MTSATHPHVTADGFDEALGLTIQQYLFALKIRRAELGESLNVPGPSISNRLRGNIRWSASDIAISAGIFGVTPNDLMPAPDGKGGWTPAAYVPTHAEGPRRYRGPVAREGFEPSTSRL